MNIEKEKFIQAMKQARANVELEGKLKNEFIENYANRKLHLKKGKILTLRKKGDNNNGI